MSEAPVTQPNLLVQLRKPSADAAWTVFVEIYAPLAYGFARKQGLKGVDGAGMRQRAHRAVVGGIYDPGRGSFRAWLFPSSAISSATCSRVASMALDADIGVTRAIRF
jgi:RNA polymerase sigma-70 factor (ECF subfamily)